MKPALLLTLLLIGCTEAKKVELESVQVVVAPPPQGRNAEVARASLSEEEQKRMDEAVNTEKGNR